MKNGISLHFFFFFLHLSGLVRETSIDSYICVCTQSVAAWHVPKPLGNSPVHFRKGESEKVQCHDYGSSFDLEKFPWKILGVPQDALAQSSIKMIEACWLRLSRCGQTWDALVISTKTVIWQPRFYLFLAFLDNWFLPTFSFPLWPCILRLDKWWGNTNKGHLVLRGQWLTNELSNISS